MTVEQLLATVSSPELTEWRAFFELQDEGQREAPAGADIRSKFSAHVRKFRDG